MSSHTTGGGGGGGDVQDNKIRVTCEYKSEATSTFDYLYCMHVITDILKIAVITFTEGVITLLVQGQLSMLSQY